MSEQDETTAQREAKPPQNSGDLAPAAQEEKPGESAASPPAPAAPAVPPKAQPAPVAEAKPQAGQPAAPEAKPTVLPPTPAAPVPPAGSAHQPQGGTPSARPPAPETAAPAGTDNLPPKPVENKPVTVTDSGRDTLFVTSPSTSSPPKSAGYTCPKCGHLNRAGILVCEKCGTLLIGDEQVGGTKRFEEQQAAASLTTVGAPTGITETNEIITAAVITAGSNQFTDNMVLRLEIEGAPTPILLHPKFETSLGRRDPATGTMPDVDLSAYAGYRLGVSRKHAIIRLKNERLEIYDLGSSNGTSVNGTRLTPHQPQILRDGDEVLLGKMMVRVLFQMRSRRT